jgi:hypothetical protein
MTAIIVGLVCLVLGVRAALVCLWLAKQWGPCARCRQEICEAL